MRQEIADMAHHAADWLSRRELYARTVTIKVRYNDFTTITRSHTDTPSRDAEHIVRRAIVLLDKTEAAQRPVRLLGVSVHNFSATSERTQTPARTRDSHTTRLPFDA
jgi:DNA polymerase-4